MHCNVTLTLKVAPTEGMALLHLHGDKCMMHEARNVEKGVKYVFRSDIVFAWGVLSVMTRSSDTIKQRVDREVMNSAISKDKDQLQEFEYN